MDSIKYSKAYWLVNHTVLTFKQIAQYCEILEIEVTAIADGLSKMCSSGYNLLEMGEITAEEIKRCEADPEAVLQGSKLKKTTKKSKLSF